MRISIGNWSGNFGMIVLIVILIVIIAVHTGCSCRQENYSNINSINNINTFSNVNSKPPSTANWDQPTLLVTPGEPLPQGVIEIITRPKQPIPLPNGQLDMFAKTSFSPKCCPNTFSNSMGCACMTLEQLNYLNQRGGNNVPPEF